MNFDFGSRVEELVNIFDLTTLKIGDAIEINDDLPWVDLLGSVLLLRNTF